MGRCADMILATEGPTGATALVQKIGVVSCARGVARAVTGPLR